MFQRCQEELKDKPLVISQVETLSAAAAPVKEAEKTSSETRNDSNGYTGAHAASEYQGLFR